MRAGQLDQSVFIRTPSYTNTFGDVAASWSTSAAIPAHVITERGSEAFESARIKSRAIIRVLVRYRTDITNRAQVTWHTQDYNVLHVDHSEKRKGELWFTAEAIIAE